MPGMDEAKIFEALGVTQSADPSAANGEGEREQEPKIAGASAEAPEPAGAGAISAGGQPPAEAPPALRGGEKNGENDAGTRENPSDAEGNGDAGTAGKSDDLTPEQRRENAAQRRRQEQKAAIDQAVQDALAKEREQSESKWKSFFAKANLKNTLTGQPITNLEEFDTWARDFDAAKLQRDLKAGKLTPEGLEKAISNNPVMQRMKEITERDEAAKRESDMTAAKAKIDAELQEIHKLDPSINSTADLLNMPTAKEFYEYVRKGNTFLDAFYLANRERLAARTAEAAKQQTMNNARSKDHLNATGAARGGGAASVPAEEMEIFKLLNPTATEAEIQAYYNKSKT